MNKAATAGTVEVVKDEKITLDQQEWNVIEIVASVDEVPFFYKIIYGSRKKTGTVQLLFYSGNDQASAVRAISQNITPRFD